MNSFFELQLQVDAHRQQLLDEAEAQRLVDRLRPTTTPALRARAATALYALADRINPACIEHLEGAPAVAR